jgi:polyhydroxyalkanoate synthase
MFPLMIRPDQAVKEIVGFNQKLLNGLNTLNALGKIDVGVSPKEAVYCEDKMVLYRFKPLVEQPLHIPVLIVYALVNRPYMADLQEDRSTVKRLLQGAWTSTSSIGVTRTPPIVISTWTITSTGISSVAWM